MMQPLRCDRNWENQEWLIAIHEAGHCLGHLSIGEQIITASIIPTAETLGHVLPLRKAGATYGEISAVPFLAGTIAVDLAFGSHWLQRDPVVYPDWAGARLFLRPVTAKGRDLSVDEEARIDEMIERIGAERLCVAVDAVWGARHPEQSEEIEDRLTRSARMTEALLRRKWPSVLAVANALMERKTLTGGEVAAIVRGESWKNRVGCTERPEAAR
jgi:hypothetical protein